MSQTSSRRVPIREELAPILLKSLTPKERITKVTAFDGCRLREQESRGGSSSRGIPLEMTPPGYFHRHIPMGQERNGGAGVPDQELRGHESY